VIRLLVLAAAAALAVDEPASYGTARLGSLTVTSGILVSAKSVVMQGVWNDAKVSCRVNRRLTVKADVNYIPAGGNPRRFVRRGVFLDTNCAEGGPNVGFTITARQPGFACPNGAWKPARYSFVVRTIEPTRKLQSVVSLDWFKTARCGS
jgi:hypothetical protein